MQRLMESEMVIGEAQATHHRVEAHLARLGIPGVLELTGASSTPGALTKGDIDLHLRVEPASFADVLSQLDETLERANLHAWADTLAVYNVPGDTATEMAVTPVGSEHDRRFSLAWERLRSEPQVLDEYNSLKSTAFGTPSYDTLKAAFFTSITAS